MSGCPIRSLDEQIRLLLIRIQVEPMNSNSLSSDACVHSWHQITQAIMLQVIKEGWLLGNVGRSQTRRSERRCGFRYATRFTTMAYRVFLA